MGDQVMPSRPNAKYYYLKGDLKNFERLFLALYLRDKYAIPMTAAQAPPDYDGPISCLLESKDDIIDFIWDRYREDGMVGKRSLLKKAPRDPAFDTGKSSTDDEDEHEDEHEDEAVEREEKKEEEVTEVGNNAEEKTMPGQRQRPRPSAKTARRSAKKEQNVREIPISTGKSAKPSEHEEAPDAADASVLTTLAPYLDNATSERQAIYERLEAYEAKTDKLGEQLDEMQTLLQQLATFVSESLHDVTNVMKRVESGFPSHLSTYASHQGRLLSILLSDLRMDPSFDPEPNERLRESLHQLVNVGAQTSFIHEVPDTYEDEEDEGDEDEGDEDEGYEDAEDEGDEDEEVSSSFVVFSTEDDFLVEINGEQRLISLEDLQDPEAITDGEFEEIGRSLGISVRGMSRVRSVPLLWEALAAAAEDE